MPKQIRKILVVGGLVSVLAIALNLPAMAAGLRLEPSIALEEKWDSNIYSSSSEEVSDFVFRARPEMAALITAFETTMRISGGFEFERYAKESELDDENAAVNLRLSTSEPLRLTRRFSIRPSAFLVETQDTTRRSELIEDPGGTGEIVSSETVVTGRIRSRDYGAALTMHYLVGPRTGFSLGGSWSRRDFLDNVTGLDLEESRTVLADASLQYRLTRRFSSGVFLNAGRNEFERSPTARTYAAGLTGTYELTELYTLTARAGYSYLKEDADATGDENTQSSPYGSFSLNYAWKSLQARFYGNYDLSGGGSFGETTKRGTVGLSLRKRFSERWSGDISVSYQSNRSTEEQSTLDISTVRTAAGIRYAAAEWASFRLGGDVLRQRSDGPEGSDVERESVVLGIDLSTVYPLF